MVLGMIKILGIVIFLYLIWRNLNEDYQDNLLISYGWSSVLVLLVGGSILTNFNFAGWWQFWRVQNTNLGGGIGLAFLWTWWCCVRYGWKLWSFLEDVLPIYYLFVCFIWVSEKVGQTFGWKNILVLLILVGGYLLSNLMRDKYRSFVWYKSGKKGFVFFFVNIWLCLALATMAFFGDSNWLAAGFYIIMSLIFGVGLGILGDVYGAKK
ncbi:MAG: hypothetical protein WAV41_03470 [Microgenomates group bacterium]